jgi:hypothetical protein
MVFDAAFGRIINGKPLPVFATGRRNSRSGLKAGSRKIHFKAKRCDVIVAIGENDSGHVHSCLVLNGAQGGGFDLSWLNDGDGGPTATC